MHIQSSTLLTLVFSIMVPFVISGQVSSGIQGGLSIFQIKNYKDVGIQHQERARQVKQFGFYLGIPLEWEIGKGYSFVFEPNFSQKGNVSIIVPEHPTHFDDYRSNTLVLNYLGQAVMFKKYFQLGKEGRGFKVGTGIEPAFLLGGKRILSWNDVSGKDEEYDLELSKEFNANGYRWNRWDVSWLADVSILTETRVGTFIIGSRTSLDLIPNHRYETRPSDVDSMYNWGFMIYGGYMIPDGDNPRYKDKSDIKL